MWTLDDLVDRVRRALAAEYPGAPNGRVRDLPDRRAIRWYTTTGLVDRPLGMRGRSALYGPRHLLQLVALKRRQADGRTLAEIQAELAGADDEALAAVARVPTELLTAEGGTPGRRFWAEEPTVTPSLPAVGGVMLAPGVFLVLPALPTADERAAIAASARPLMDLLAERGLLTCDDGSPS